MDRIDLTEHDLGPPIAVALAERTGGNLRRIGVGRMKADVAAIQMLHRLANEVGRRPTSRLVQLGQQLAGRRGVARHGSLRLLDLDLDVDAGGEVETLERVDRLRGGLQDVEQTLVDPHLEVLA